MCASAKVDTIFDKGIRRGQWASARKRRVQREIQECQHIPGFGRLGQRTLTSTGGSTWQHQNCRFLADVEVFEK